jgi:hypothetical protein
MPVTREVPSAAECLVRAPDLLDEFKWTIAQTRTTIEESRALMAALDKVIARR